jgi:hypothetical protein
VALVATSTSRCILTMRVASTWLRQLAIKVDGRMIVDGNHRYIAARILGRAPPVQQWIGGRPANAVSWETIPIDPKAW